MTTDRPILRECPHCGNGVRGEWCCGYNAEGRLAIDPDLFARIAAMAEARAATMRPAPAVDFDAIANQSPSSAPDPSDVWDKRGGSHEGGDS